MSYTPTPGSVASRALVHLESLPAGTELMTSALAEAIGASGTALLACMEAPRRHGVVFRRRRDANPRSPWWWSLVDHEAPLVVSRHPPLEIPRFGASNGNTPKGANRDATGFEGRGSQEPDATDCEARSKVMAPEGSESPTGRGTNGAPALGAAPARSPDGGPTGAWQPAAAGPTGDEQGRGRDSTRAQVDGCRAPECHAGACSGRAQRDHTSPPASPLRCALWSNGTLQIDRDTVGGAAELILLSRDETRALVAYLDAISLDLVRDDEVAMDP